MPHDHDHHGAHKHVAPAPFVDLHCSVRNGVADIEAILPITEVEDLLVGFGIDVSRSFLDEWGRSGGIQSLLGLNKNLVNESMQAIIPYLAQMDANGAVRISYFAGGDGSRVFQVGSGEITAEQAKTMQFAGPKTVDEFGTSTQLLPQLRDFVDYVRQRVAAGEVVKKALLVIITDGEFHDYEALIAYTKQMEQAISEGKLPRIIVSIVGVGDQVNEDQLEQLLHDTYDTDASLATFCYNVINEMPSLASILAHLADTGMVAYRGGAVIKTIDGRVLQTYEDAVPALIELQVPVADRQLVFVTNGKEFPFDIDEDDDHDGGEHDGEGHHDDDDDDHDADGHGGHHH